MKTTLNVHDALLAEAKALAARQRLSLTRLVEEGLRLRLRLRAAELPRATVRRRPMPTAGRRGGLAHGLGGLAAREMLDLVDSDSDNGDGKGKKAA